MTVDRRARLLVVAVAVLTAIAGALGGAAIADGRRVAMEERLAIAEAALTGIRTDQDALSRDIGGVQLRLNGVGTTARIRLGAEHQPVGGGIFGGLQAFVETGTTAYGCVASVSETNIGNYGPFDVLCTPRAPVIDGRERKGVLIAVYRPLHSGDLGQMFPAFTIVEVTISQPGATRYAHPVVCVIGAPTQC